MIVLLLFEVLKIFVPTLEFSWGEVVVWWSIVVDGVDPSLAVRLKSELNEILLVQLHEVTLLKV